MVIELKNDIEISGVIVDADPGMKVTLSDVKEVLPDGSSTTKDFMVVEGPAIRYVHLPRSINMRSLLAEYVKRTDRIKVQNQPRAIHTKPVESRPKSDIILKSLDD